MVRAAPKVNILLGPDETSIQDSSVDDHYSYRAGAVGRGAYNESTITEPPADRGRSLPGVHGVSTTSRCRLAQPGDTGFYSECPGRLPCVEMRTCGCSLVPCPPPPPPPVSGGSVTIGRRCQDPAGGLYATRRSPVGPTSANRPKPSVYWQISGRSEKSLQEPRRTDLSTERHVISGENDDTVTRNRAGDAGSVGAEIDTVSKPDKSPDLVLNGKHRDQKLTGSHSSACTSSHDDHRCDSSTAPKLFHNQRTLDDK